MGDSIISGDARNKIPIIEWKSGTNFLTDTVSFKENRLYVALSDHVASTDIQDDINAGKIKRVSPNTFDTYYEIGPYNALSGYHSFNKVDTGAIYTDYANDEVVIAYKHRNGSVGANGAHHGAYVGIGFFLRIAKLYKE